jgi:hypothetical protein
MISLYRDNLYEFKTLLHTYNIFWYFFLEIGTNWFELHDAVHRNMWCNRNNWLKELVTWILRVKVHTIIKGCVRGNGPKSIFSMFVISPSKDASVKRYAEAPYPLTSLGWVVRVQWAGSPRVPPWARCRGCLPPVRSRGPTRPPRGVVGGVGFCYRYGPRRLLRYSPVLF